MNEIILTGCMPTPLSSYLKSLGLLRLLTRHESQIKAAWHGEHLVLSTKLSPGDVREHLLNNYAPTPILAPWNGGSGFYEKDNKTAFNAIVTSQAARLTSYRTALHVAEQGLIGLDRTASPKGTAKSELLLRLRGLLPDDALEWFDAAILLAGDDPKFPPLLGTGGNDGRLDFTNNFMQRVMDLMDPKTGASTKMSDPWLDLALFADPAPGLVKNAIGQFAPGQVGGPNATTGYDIKGSMNPWEFVLMIEGALPFAAAAVRRNEHDEEGVLSYPFTVRASAAGAGNIGADDAASARGELWMPLWSQPASYTEVKALLAEGRVALGTKPARDALDFVRAVHRLGGYRGVDRFQRYGLLMRSGKAYLATPLERVQITTDPHSSWIDDLDQNDWLSRFRRFTQGDHAPNRFVTFRKRLEDLLFDLARRRPSPAQVQNAMILLGELQSALASSTKIHDTVRPVPKLSAQWVQAADSKNSTFCIARALAGLHGAEGKPFPLRSLLFPVHPRTNDWIETTCAAKTSANDPACRVRLYRPYGRDLISMLITLLDRRLSVATRMGFDDKPLLSYAGIDLNDLNAFLSDNRLDADIAALLPGLALCDIPRTQEHKAGDGEVPAAFSLLKLTSTPNAWLKELADLPKESNIPMPPGLLQSLATGNADKARHAVEITWRRLRGSGLTPAMPVTSLPELIGIEPRRAAAALLIPLTYGATGALVRSALAPPEIEAKTA